MQDCFRLLGLPAEAFPRLICEVFYTPEYEVILRASCGSAAGNSSGVKKEVHRLGEHASCVTMAETREVCKICFASTSHKPTPTLTPESKASIDKVSKKKKCLACHQEWAPIRVSKEVGAGSTKWVRIRPRPKIPANIDFQICKNIQGKVECPKGHDCSYAHSRIELLLWNKDREREPRTAPQINGPYQYTLCKHMLNTGNCPYGQRCTFAHSEEELENWLRAPAGQQMSQNGGYAGGGQQFPPVGVGAGMIEYRCDTCNLSCTSRKQLEDHFSGSRHKQQMSSKGLPMHPYHHPPPAQSTGSRRVIVRRRPLLSFPINGYKLCLHSHPGRRCIYGEYCTFAHSQYELEEWNRQLQFSHAPRHPPGGGGGQFLRFGQNYQESPAGMNAVGMGGAGGMGGHASGGTMEERRAPEPYGSYSGLDDFEEEMAQDSQDFASLLRSRVASEQKQNQDIRGFEVGGRERVGELTIVLSPNFALRFNLGLEVISIAMFFNPLPTSDAYMCHELPYTCTHNNYIGGLILGVNTCTGFSASLSCFLWSVKV